MTQDNKTQNETLLLDFLNGHLNAKQERKLRTALKHDSNLRALLSKIEEELAQTLISAQTVEPSLHLRKRLMQSIEYTHRFEHFSGAIAKLLQIPVQRAIEYLRNIDEASSWDLLFPGVSLYHVEGGPELQNAITGFVQLNKGALFPDHKHAGIEHIFILQGTLINSGKKSYRPGDILVMDEDSHHYIEASKDETLLYLSVIETGIYLFGTFIGADSPLL